MGASEACHHKYLEGTDYQECIPFLKNPRTPNKPYDILVSEPPFEFSYRSYARCTHGVVFRQEAHRCVGDFEDVHGLDPFLEKFSCLLNNLIAEAVSVAERQFYIFKYFLYHFVALMSKCVFARAW